METIQSTDREHSEFRSSSSSSSITETSIVEQAPVPESDDASRSEQNNPEQQQEAENPSTPPGFQQPTAQNNPKQNYPPISDEEERLRQERSRLLSKKSKFERDLLRAPKEEPNTFLLKWDKNKKDYILPVLLEPKAQKQLTIEELRTVIYRLKLKNPLYVPRTDSKFLEWMGVFIGVPFVIPTALIYFLFPTLLPFIAFGIFGVIGLTVLLSQAGKYYWLYKIRERRRKIDLMLEVINKEDEFKHLKWSCSPLGSYLSVKMRNIDRNGVMKPEGLLVEINRPKIEKNGESESQSRVMVASESWRPGGLSRMVLQGPDAGMETNRGDRQGALDSERIFLRRDDGDRGLVLRADNVQFKHTNNIIISR